MPEGVSSDGRLCVPKTGALANTARRSADAEKDPLDPCSFLRYGFVPPARNRALCCASDATKIIDKMFAGKPHAQFEMGVYGEGSAPVLNTTP
jgi:hypothetical protein